MKQLLGIYYVLLSLCLYKTLFRIVPLGFEQQPDLFQGSRELPLEDTNDEATCS